MYCIARAAWKHKRPPDFGLSAHVDEKRQFVLFVECLTRGRDADVRGTSVPQSTRGAVSWLKKVYLLIRSLTFLYAEYVTRG